ncbi:integrase core domain-containing protein [Streptomyces sp. NPDC001635]
MHTAIEKLDNSITDFGLVDAFLEDLKRETLRGTRDYGDADTCRRTVFAWLAHYNTRRRHAADGHLSPNAYERRHHTAELTLTARSMTACPPSRGKARRPVHRTVVGP